MVKKGLSTFIRFISQYVDAGWNHVRKRGKYQTVGNGNSPSMETAYLQRINSASGR